MLHHPTVPPPSERWAPLLALLALALALGSFAWAERHPEFPWDGPILLATAAGLLLIALARIAPAPASAPEPSARAMLARWRPLAHVSRWRIGAFWLSLALTAWLLSHLAVPNRPSYTGEVVAWLAAMALFVLAVAPPVRRPREDWGLWWEVNRQRVLVISLIIGVALALRLWGLGSLPPTLGGDEGSQGLEAVSIIEGRLRNPFTTGWLGVPTMSFFFNSLTIRLMGNTITALRLPWVFVGTATVLVTFWLVTRLRGLTLGLMTAGLLAAYHYHIHYSRLGSNQVADPLFVALSLLFLYRAYDRRSPLDWAMVGIVMGVAQFFYAGARLTVVVAALCTLYLFWQERYRPASLRGLLGGALTMAGSFLITAAPMIQYAIRFPADYNARLNQVGIVQSGWLAREVVNRGSSTVAVLWDQFQRSFLAFNLYPDRTFWYGNSEPLMDGLWGILFLLGLLYATLRLLPPRAESRLVPLVLWWWGGMLLGGMLTESPPSTQRLIVLAPPACFFVALAFLRLTHFLQEAFGRRDPRGVATLLALGVLFLGGSSIHRYFWEEIPSLRYGNEHARIATEMAFFLHEHLGPEQRVIFLGPPAMYLGFGTLPYLEPRSATQGVDLHEPLTGPPTATTLGLAPQERPLFIALPFRESELALAEAAFPGGQTYGVYDTAFGRHELLFWVYEP